MALRPEYALAHSEFDEFLLALVGEDINGTQITVLTALTRLGFDPWKEAARLADLSVEAAEGALAAAIARLPVGDWKISDAGSIAVRLVSHLPRRRTAAAQAPREDRGDGRKKAGAMMWLIAIGLAAVVLFGMWNQYADHSSESVRGAVSSVR
jgi:hypothetical protein